MGTIGHDFGAYAQWLDKNDIARDFLKVVPDMYTAQAYITTDLDDNQITAFHPGAMAQADTQNVDGKGVKIGSVSAESREAMRSEEHTSELQSLMRISYAVFCLKKKNNEHY